MAELPLLIHRILWFSYLSKSMLSVEFLNVLIVLWVLHQAIAFVHFWDIFP